ncbi:MAG: hypothetical protein Q8Q42_00430 [Nanoarchaeota archaeon]|nr:hypothetical protein [Nanoarchaeota archaeon]
MAIKLNRPGVVWIYSVIVAFSVLFSIFDLVGALASSDYLVVIFSLLMIVSQAIFLYLFFMLSRKSLMWLYISLGVGFVFSLIALDWLIVIIIPIFGWIVWDYISHKKVKGKPIFV